MDSRTYVQAKIPSMPHASGSSNTPLEDTMMEDVDFDVDMNAVQDFQVPVTNPPAPPQSQHARVEDVPDEDDEPSPIFSRYIQPYPRPVA